MHSPSSDFITTRLGAPRWVPDWRTMLAQAEEADSPHPALMRQLEGAIADLKPRDIDTPETLSRLTDVRGLSVTAKERLVRLCARVGAEHAGEKTWDAAVRTGMDTRIGRAMLQKKDPGLVGAYANLVSRTAIRSPLNPVKAASNLPLAKEAEGIISAELGKRSTQKAVERVLQTAWNAEKSTSVKLASQARRSLERGDSMLAFFRNLGPVGKLINVAVLTGMLSGMLPATASAGYRKQGTAVAERAAGDPGQATKARPNPVAPAPGDAVSPRAPEAPLRVESTKSQPAPPSTGKLPDLKTERSFTDGQNAITIRADSGVNVPSDPGAEKNGKVRMPAVTPTASVSVTNGDMQANLEFMGRVWLGGMDSETAWGMGAALAYIDAMEESGLAVRAVYDNDDGFKDIAARLGISVGERGQFFVTAGMKQRFVNEVSRLVNIGDPHLRTRIKNFLATAEYNYKNADDPAELVQDLFVIVTAGRQPGKDLGKIGTYQTDDGNEISEGGVYAQYRGADKFQIEFGTRLQVNSWLVAEIQAGASVTSIKKGFDGKMKQIFSPLLGGSLEADLDGNWKLVFDARIEKELASVGASASYDYRTINASIGVEARKEAGRKVVELRPALKLKTTPETFGGLLQGKLPEGAPEARKDKKPNRIDFARILKFPQPYTSEALFIDAHGTFDERRAHRDIAVEKWAFESLERNPDGSMRSGLTAIGRPLEAISLVSMQEYAEYFEVAGDKLRVFFRSDRGSKDGKPLPPGNYRLALAEQDGQYSVSDVDVEFGSSKFSIKPVVVNDIPAELYQSVVANFVKNPSVTIEDVKEAVAEAIALPDISSMEFSQATIAGATLSLSATHAAGGVAHVAIIRGKKLTDEEIRAIGLDAIKSGKIGEYVAVPLDAEGKAKVSVKSATDGVDITVVAIAESAGQKISKEAEGTTITLPSLAGFASVPKCETVFNTLVAACSATVTKTEATVHIAYFAEALQDLSDTAKVRDAKGAAASADFATSGLSGKGQATFKEAGTYYGYAVTVNANGISKTAVSLGTIVIGAPREAPSISSIECDANAETCAISTDTPGARLNIAIKDSEATFSATADARGVATIDYAKKLAPGSYEFTITLRHPTEDRISRTDTKTVRIAANPAPTLVGKQVVSGATTSSYRVAGQASEGGDVYVLSLPASDPEAAKMTAEAVIARGEKSALEQTEGKWTYSVLVSGRAPSTDYITLTVFKDNKDQLSTVYRQEARTADVPNGAPTHSLTISEITHESAKFTFGGADAEGDKITRYYVILPATAKAPSVEQVLAGTDAEDRSVTLSGNTQESSIIATGLSAQTEYKVYSVWSDGKLSSKLDTDDLKTLKLPNTAPEHALVISEVTHESAKFTFSGADAQKDEVTRYYVILPKGSKAPTAAQIIAGTDADDKPVTLSGETKEVSLAVSGLSPSTKYEVYSVGSDGKLASGVDKDTIDTLAKPNGAPSHSSSMTSVTATSAVIAFVTVDPDKDGTTSYWIILPKDARAPSAAQIIAGTDADDKPVRLSGSTAEATVNVTGLTPEKDYVKYSVAQDSKQATSGVDKDEFSTTKVPNTAPGHSLTTSDLTHRSVKLTFGGIDEQKDPITRYWVVLPAGSPPPTVAQIKLGQDAAGQAVTLSGSTQEASATVSGLEEKKAYDIYSASSDGKLDSDREKDTITTLERPNTAPAHSLTVSDVTHQSVKFTFAVVDAESDDFTTYYVILPAGATPPSAEQIVAAKDANNQPVALSGSTTETSLTVSGLSASTGYVAYSASRDVRGSISLRDSDAFATLAVPNSAPTHSASLVSVTHNAAVVGITNADANPGDTVTTYYVLLPIAAPAPSATQIREGKDSTGATASIRGNTTAATANLTGLSASTSYRLYSIAYDGQAASGVDTTDITTQATPNTAPTFSASVGSVTHESAVASFTRSDDYSTVRSFYVVLPASAPAPSIAQVLAGQDSTGATASIRGNTTSATASLTGLSASTAYKMYSIGKEDDGTLTSALDTDSFTTDAPPNNPPSHTASIGSITHTGAILSFAGTDPEGATVTRYYVVLPASAAAPSAIQIREGKDSTGTTASIRGNTTTSSANITGLSASTEYVAYSIGDDGSLSSAVDSDAFTTEDPPNDPPTLSTSITSFTATTAVLAFASNDDHSTVRHYYVVLPASASAPTVSQVVVGQDSTGTTASIRGNTTSATASLTGLSPNTAYKVYSVGKEEGGVLMSSLDTDTLTTLYLSVTNTPSSIAVSGGSLFTNDTTPTVTATVPANATSMQVRITTVGGTVISDWSATDVSIASGTASWTPSSPLAESAGVANSRYVVTWRGVDGNGTPGPTAALSGDGIDIRTSGPGTLPSWGESPATAPTLQSTEYTKIFDSPNGFGGAVSDLSCTTPLGGSVTSCTYDADSDKITVIFNTPAQAGFRLVVSGKDKYGVSFSKLQNASNLAPLVPTASPTNFQISTASDTNGDGRIGTLTPTLSADIPAGATHLRYRVGSGAWTAVADGQTTFSPTGLAEGSNTIQVIGANANWQAADSTAVSLTIDVRTAGPGTLPSWGDGSIAPTQQSTQYTRSFTAPDGFGGSVTNLNVTAPNGGTINSATYNSTTGTIDVTFTTPAQAGFRLTLSYTDAYEVTKTKTQIVSNLASLVPTASPTNAAISSASDANGDGKISTTTPTLSADIPAGATHLAYQVDNSGTWTAVADGQTSFTLAALDVGDHTVRIVGANANGRAADSTAVSVSLSLRTSGPGTLPSWWDGSIAPTRQSTEYTRVFTSPNGFGGAISDLSCTAPLGGSVTRCTYDAATDSITVVFNTAPQAGFRLVVSGKDAYGASFSKLQNASGLTP